MTSQADIQDSPQAQQLSPYERIGGAAVVSAMVNRFYDLMESEPGYGDLRGMHAADLGPMRASLTGFLTGWMGGPRDWFASGKCVMSAHSPYAITADLGHQWVDAMSRAIKECVPDSDMGTALTQALQRMASSMISR